MNCLPTCYAPPKEIRKLRDTVRYRKTMVDTRTSLKNKIRSALAREGIVIEDSDILGENALQELDGIKMSSPVQRDAVDRL